jgi:hypothetical protein
VKQQVVLTPLHSAQYVVGPASAVTAGGGGQGSAGRGGAGGGSALTDCLFVFGGGGVCLKRARGS